jgi:hypothetical protein
MNGHGERRLFLSFVVFYCKGYHCLRETVAWPAIIGVLEKSLLQELGKPTTDEIVILIFNAIL